MDGGGHFPSRGALLEAAAEDGFERLLAKARVAAEDDPRAGLERLLRYALDLQFNDLALAEVLGSSESARTRTSRLRVDLLDAVERLLGRAREAGAIREDVGADDLRRLVCGIEHAVRVGGDGRDEIDRYLGVLLSGLRPDR